MLGFTTLMAQMIQWVFIGQDHKSQKGGGGVGEGAMSFDSLIWKGIGLEGQSVKYEGYGLWAQCVMLPKQHKLWAAF